MIAHNPFDIHAHHRHSARGHTLLEVLITLFTLTVGLLGVAGLQMHSTLALHRAQIHTQAALLAQDMAERVRAGADAATEISAWRSLIARRLPAGEGQVESDSVGVTITLAWKDREATRSLQLDARP